MILLIIICLLVGTGFVVFWNCLMFAAKSENEDDIAFYAYRALQEKFESLRIKFEADTEALENTEGFARTVRKMFHDPKSSKKEAKKIKDKMDKLDAGNFGGINFLVLPGYAFLRIFNVNADMSLFAKVIEIYAELKGREHAVHNSQYLFACMASAAIGGVGASLMFGVLVVAAGEASLGWLICLAGAVMSVLAAAGLYSGVQSNLKKRRAEIMLDFPQAVTELALLTSSGMEIFKAWEKVASGRHGVLYGEMKQTAKEVLKNGVDPNEAFDTFIRRCGTKETARLGASILQNLRHGNEEISKFLIELSQEAWEERKHTARRLGAAAQSKLLIPMMLIFLGIIFIVMAPAMIGIGGMGF